MAHETDELLENIFVHPPCMIVSMYPKTCLGLALAVAAVKYFWNNDSAENAPVQQRRRGPNKPR